MICRSTLHGTTAGLCTVQPPGFAAAGASIRALCRRAPQRCPAVGEALTDLPRRICCALCLTGTILERHTSDAGHMARDP